MPPETVIFTNQLQIGDLVFDDANQVPTQNKPAGTPSFHLMNDDFTANLDKGIITITPAADGLSVTFTPTGNSVGSQNVTANLGNLMPAELEVTVHAADGFVPNPGPAVSIRFVLRQPTPKP